MRTTDMNRKSRKKISTPQVGIFWIDDSGKMFAASVSLSDAEDYGEFRIYDKSHFEMWDSATRANPKWKGKEYEEVPRGRVIYKIDLMKPKFIVYLPEQIEKFKNKVVARFCLPIKLVRYDFKDAHYKI